MKIELVTVEEGITIGIVTSRLLNEGHGAFGESDNSYESIVHVGGKVERLSDDDLILLRGESPNREVIQVISEWECSDKLLDVVNPKALNKRKKEKYKRYIELKMEIESDEFYKPKA